MFGLRNIVKASSLFLFKKPIKTNHARLYFNTLRAFNSSQNPPSRSPETSSQLNDLTSKANKGINALHQRDFRTAMESLQQAVEIYNANKDKVNYSKEEVPLLLQTFYELGKIHEKNHDIAESLKLYNEAVSLAEKSNLINTVEMGNLYNALGRINLKQSNPQEAIKYLEKAGGTFMEVEKSNKGIDLGTQVIENAYMIAVVCGNTGQVDKALVLLQGILQKYQNEQASESELDLSLVYQSIGNMTISKGDIEKALEYWNTGLDRAVKKYGETSPQSLSFYINVVQGLLQKGQYEHAKSYAEKNLELCQKTFNEDHPKVAEGLLMVGLTNFHTGNSEKALQSYLKAAEILSGYPEQYHDQVSFAYMTIAEIYLIQKKEPEARESFDKALIIAIKALGKSHPKVADFYLLWGELLRYKTENIKESRELYQKALEIYLKYGGVDEAKIVDIYYNIGLLLHHEGDLAEAMKNLQEGLKIALTMAEKPRTLDDIYNFIGSIYFQQQKYQESLENFEKAVEICSQSKSEKGDLDVYYRNLGLAHEHNGHAEKAVDWYKKALEWGAKKRGKDSDITDSHLKLVTETLEKLKRNEEAQELKKKYGQGEN